MTATLASIKPSSTAHSPSTTSETPSSTAKQSSNAHGSTSNQPTPKTSSPTSSPPPGNCPASPRDHGTQAFQDGPTHYSDSASSTGNANATAAPHGHSAPAATNGNGTNPQHSTTDSATLSPFATAVLRQIALPIYNGSSVKHIAKELGIAPSSVKACIKRLQAEIQEREQQ